MTIYAQIKLTTTSNLFEVARIADSAEPITSPDYVDLTGITPQPVVGDFYTLADGFSATIPAAVTAGKNRFLSPVQFWLGRFTDDERGIAYALATQDGGGVTLTMAQRGRLKAFLALSAANRVNLDHKETVFIVNALETVGALAAGRAAQILA